MPPNKLWSPNSFWNHCGIVNPIGSFTWVLQSDSWALTHNIHVCFCCWIFYDSYWYLHNLFSGPLHLPFENSCPVLFSQYDKCTPLLEKILREYWESYHSQISTIVERMCYLWEIFAMSLQGGIFHNLLSS